MGQDMSITRACGLGTLGGPAFLLRKRDFVSQWELTNLQRLKIKAFQGMEEEAKKADAGARLVPGKAR